MYRERVEKLRDRERDGQNDGERSRGNKELEWRNLGKMTKVKEDGLVYPPF